MPGDVTVDSFVSWRSKQEVSPKTANEYLNAARALFNWMETQGRIDANPLKRARKADVRGEQERKRAFTDEEFNKVLAVAGGQRLLYLTAAYTGLRLGELRQLRWGDLHLDHERPHMVARAATTKNRREATQPVHPMLVQELAAARKPEAKPSDLVFSGCHTATAARRMTNHLADAGLKRLDDMGRKLCFHSLRYTFATLLAKSGVSQRMAQELLRHSDPRLTANIYTDVTCLPTFDAVYGLNWHGDSKQSERGEIVCPLDTESDTNRRLGGSKTGKHWHCFKFRRIARKA